MGALIFYTVIYFIGYYMAHFLNRLAGHALVRSRRVSGLVLVFGVGAVHAYKIIRSPVPHDHGDGAGYALGWYVILPVTIIVAAVLYFAWQDKNDNDVS